MKLAVGSTSLRLVALSAADAMAARQVAYALATVNRKLADSSSDFVTQVANGATALASLFLSRFADRDLRTQAVGLIQVVRELAAIHDHQDSLAELGEEQQLQLQMVMDRLSKLYTTLSNIMKSIADTASTIVSNIK